MRPARLWIYRLITKWLPETRCFGLKAAMLRWCGAKIGKNVRVCSSAYISGSGQLNIGDDVWIGEKCFISPNSGTSVEIAAHCDFAPEVLILNGTHKITPHESHIAGNGFSRSVIISEGCWLGARSIILPGVRLLPKTVVAAGAVVVKSPSSGLVLVAGVPAKEKKCYAEHH